MKQFQSRKESFFNNVYVSSIDKRISNNYESYFLSSNLHYDVLFKDLQQKFFFRNANACFKPFNHKIKLISMSFKKIFYF